MEYKICTKCNNKLPATNEYFAKAMKGKYGLASVCRECKKIYYRDNKSFILEKCKQYYEGNKDAKLEYAKQYRDNNKEKISKSLKQWNMANKDKVKHLNKEYYSKNKNIILEKLKQYRKENAEKIKNTKGNYYQGNKTQIMIKRKIYRQNNKDIVNIASHRRRSIKRKLPHTLTTNQWKEIKLKFNNKCAYCGEEKPLAQEHFIPISKGGGYTIENIIPACRNCNSSKNDSDFSKWYPQYKYYLQTREKYIRDYLEIVK